LSFLDRFYKKYANIKFDENPCSGSRVDPCGQTDAHGTQTDMKDLIVTFRNFENAPKVNKL